MQVGKLTFLTSAVLESWFTPSIRSWKSCEPTFYCANVQQNCKLAQFKSCILHFRFYFQVISWCNAVEFWIEKNSLFSNWNTKSKRTCFSDLLGLNLFNTIFGFEHKPTRSGCYTPVKRFEFIWSQHKDCLIFLPSIWVRHTSACLKYNMWRFCCKFNRSWVLFPNFRSHDVKYL